MKWYIYDMIYTIVRDREKVKKYLSEVNDRLSNRLTQILKGTEHQNSFLTEEDMLNLSELMGEDLEYIRKGYNGSDYNLEYIFADKSKSIDLHNVLHEAIENNTEIDKSIFNETSALYVLREA